MVIVALFLWRAPMTARRTVPRLEAFAYAVRSLWGFYVIYGETGHGNLEMDRSHDTKEKLLRCWITELANKYPKSRGGYRIVLSCIFVTLNGGGCATQMLLFAVLKQPSVATKFSCQLCICQFQVLEKPCCVPGREQILYSCGMGCPVGGPTH